MKGIIVLIGLFFGLPFLQRESEQRTPESELGTTPYFICSGCYAQPTAGTGGGVVSFPTEPSFGNGSCLPTGAGGACVPTACQLSGSLGITSWRMAAMYYSTDGGFTTHPIWSFGSDTINFGDGAELLCNKNGDTTFTVSFWEDAGATTPIDGCFYEFKCTRCNG